MGNELGRPLQDGNVLRPPDEGQRGYFGEHVEALRRYLEASHPFAFRRVRGELTFFVDADVYASILTSVTTERRQ